MYNISKCEIILVGFSGLAFFDAYYLNKVVQNSYQDSNLVGVSYENIRSTR